MPYHQKIIYQGPKTIEPIIAPCLEEVASNFTLEKPLTFSVGYREFPFLPKEFDPYFILSDGKYGRVEHDAEVDRLFGDYQIENHRRQRNISLVQQKIDHLERYVGTKTITKINARLKHLFDCYFGLVDDEGNSSFLSDHFEDNMVSINGNVLPKKRALRAMVGYNYQTTTQEVYIPTYIVLCLYAAQDKNLRLELAKTELKPSQSFDFFTKLVTHGAVHHEIHRTKAFEDIDHVVQQEYTLYGRLISKIMEGKIENNNEAILQSHEGKEWIDSSKQEEKIVSDLFGKLHLDAVEEAAAHTLSGIVHRQELNPSACERAENYMSLYLKKQHPQKTPAEFCALVNEVIEEAYDSKKDALEILKIKAER